MNIYLGSTTRNRLFALLKYLDEPAEKSCILMIYDQQGIDSKNYYLSALPGHIQIRFISRKAIRKRLDKKFSGMLLSLAAAADIRTSAHFRR